MDVVNEVNCISHSTNTLGKGMTQIILPPAIVGQIGFFSLEKENSKFKPVKLHLRIHCESHPVHAEELVNIHISQTIYIYPQYI